MLRRLPAPEPCRFAIHSCRTASLLARAIARAAHETDRATDGDDQQYACEAGGGVVEVPHRWASALEAGRDVRAEGALSLRSGSFPDSRAPADWPDDRDTSTPTT